jgi:hypothetical protein
MPRKMRMIDGGRLVEEEGAKPAPVPTSTTEFAPPPKEGATS